jgi:hypothetical protein
VAIDYVKQELRLYDARSFKYDGPVKAFPSRSAATIRTSTPKSGSATARRSKGAWWWTSDRAPPGAHQAFRRIESPA